MLYMLYVIHDYSLRDFSKNTKYFTSLILIYLMLTNLHISIFVKIESTTHIDAKITKDSN